MPFHSMVSNLIIIGKQHWNWILKNMHWLKSYAKKHTELRSKSTFIHGWYFVSLFSLNHILNFVSFWFSFWSDLSLLTMPRPSLHGSQYFIHWLPQNNSTVFRGYPGQKQFPLPGKIENCHENKIVVIFFYT